MALTDRQKEVKKLQDSGLTPTEIGERLGISTNAVYQQLRRMHSSPGTAKAKPGGNTKAGRRSAAKAAARTRSTPTPKPAAAPAAVATPLQAIRARRQAIHAELKVTGQTKTDAERAAKVAAETHNKAEQKHWAELKTLDSAEQALTGKRVTTVPAKPAKPKAAARKRPSRAKAKTASSNGSGDASTVPAAAAA